MRVLKRLAIDDNDSICFAVRKSSNFNCNLVSQRLAILYEACLLRKNEKLLMKGGCLTTSGL